MAVLLISCLLLLKVKISQRPAAFVLILAMLSIMMYLNEPNVTSDLYRIREFVRIFSRQTWAELFDSIIQGHTAMASSPTAMIYYKLLGYLNDPNVISLISGLICYGLIFYMICDFSLRMKIGSSTLTVMFFAWMAMDYFIPITSTIRSYIASVLVAFCIYRETLQGKFGWLNPVLYVIAMGMHDMGFVLVGFRVICFLLKQDMDIRKSLYQKSRFAMIGAMVLCSGLILPIVLQKLGRADSYIEGDIYSYDWEYRLCMIRLAVLWISWYWIVKRKGKQPSWLNRIWLILCFSLLLFTAFIIDFTFFMRFCFFAELLWFFPVMLAMDRLDRKKIYGLTNLWLASGAISMILTLSRGYLCSLKFW